MPKEGKVFRVVRWIFKFVVLKILSFLWDLITENI
jgi:hypothetical protein